MRYHYVLEIGTSGRYLTEPFENVISNTRIPGDAFPHPTRQAAEACAQSTVCVEGPAYYYARRLEPTGDFVLSAVPEGD